MRLPRSTYILIGLFFGGLLLLWGLEYAGFLTEAERDRRRDRVLPELIDLKEAEVRRVEIERGAEKLSFDRQGPRRWRMTAPFDVDAAPEAVERLISTVKGLRKSPEAGVLDGPAESYGLAPPEAVVRLWQDPAAPPVAALEVGRTAQQERFVRGGPASRVEVASRAPLAPVDRPAEQWRETAVVPPYASPVVGLTIRRPSLDAVLEREGRSGWMLTAPVRYPAEGGQLDQLIAALSSLRVDPKAGGFVDPAATDLALYGLAPPETTIELRSGVAEAAPLTLQVGSSPEDRPTQVYVDVGGRGNVVLVDKKFLESLPADLKALRSPHVARLNPAAVRKIEIEAPEGPFRLVRDKSGWLQETPGPSRADPVLIDGLFAAVEDLQSTEFFDPDQVTEVGLDPPSARLKIWEASADADSGGAATPSEPAFSLELGIHDLLRKVVYGRLEGDTAILVLPEAFLSSLPPSSFGFRDLDLPAIQPMNVARLVIDRPGRKTVLDPETARGPNAWRMLEPVQAEANAGAVTAALARLAELRASAFVARSADAKPEYGLDRPLFEVRWEMTQATAGPAASTPPSGRLRVGSNPPGDPSVHYAELSNFPAVFTIDAASLLPFMGEFHDPKVLTFPAQSARRLVLRTPRRTLSYARRPQPLGVASDWSPEPGTPSEGVDLSRFNNLVDALSGLRTERFIRYAGGGQPAEFGLQRPRLVIEVDFGGETPPATLRFGAAIGQEFVVAATGTDESGPVFVLPGPAWEALIQGVETALPGLPADVFAPPPPA